MKPVAAPDIAIARIAARQHGAIAYRQLIAAGLSAKAIERRVRIGLLHRLHRGVYLVGHTAAPPLSREMAAVLACGDGAVLSHGSAARLWKLLPPSPADVDVTVPGRQRRSRGGIVIHRSAALHARDFRRRHSIPLTAPPRTLLDLAAVAQPRELERAFDEAMTQRLVHPRQIEELLRRSPGRHGAGPLHALLASDGGPALTKSELEEIMLGLIRGAGLPQPEVGAIVHGREVDFFWRPQRLDVEVDSRRYHSLPKKVDADRDRDAVLHGRGVRVVRIGERRLLDDPAWVAARVAEALAQPPLAAA